MSRVLRYTVSAPPARVTEAIGAATAPESALGFAFGNRTTAALIGGVATDGSFRLRRVRTIGSAPRVVLLTGQVQPSDAGSVVVARYAFHPAFRFARAVWVLILLAFAIAVIPASTSHPELLWVPVVLGAVVGLMLAPFMWLARADRPQLRAALEKAMRQAGPWVLQRPQI